MKITVFIFMLWSLASWADTQDDIKALKKRIDELEARQEQLYLSTAEPRTDVHSYINDNLTFGDSLRRVIISLLERIPKLNGSMMPITWVSI